MHSILAARTDFSIGESILTVEKLVEAAKAAGETVVALTDTMSVTAMIDFTGKAKKAGLRPIIGTRLRISEDVTWRPGAGEKKKDMPKEHFLTVYALSETGMQAIFRLLTLANSEDRFYYTAKLGLGDLYDELKVSGGELAIVLGDEQSIMERADIVDIAKTLRKLCNHVYAPLVPIHTPYYGRMNEIALSLCAPERIEPILIRPALYEAGAADTQEIMTAISENQKVSDGWFRSRYNRDLAVISKSDLVPEITKAAQHLRARSCSSLTPFVLAFKNALMNTKILADAVTYEWSKAPVSLPRMAPDEFAKVTEECREGWKRRFTAPVFGHLPSPDELRDTYMPRLKYELETLKKLSFSGYFLLVQDIVQFAKRSGILVGPGRGSVGGSLVAYLMGITDCDPIRFGLLFERFINPERIDLPDADLDFMSERRHEIVEYLVKKYGDEHVAGVSNFGTLAAASAIRDVSRVMGMNERDYAVSKLVPKKHGANVPLPECRAEVPEIDAFARKHDTLWPIMERLEGTVRNLSQHAAGVVVGGCKLVERAVIERRKESAVVCWDKRIVEDQGLVKVDVLGLNTLDVMKLALDYIRERHGRAPDINAIPLDDPKVLAAFAKAQTTGVFQFESGGMRRLLKELGADGTITFDDITAATALYRPGPMESGMMDSFYLRKQGSEAIEYDHPLMEPILRETFGVIVYQEQIMKVSQVIAGYSGAAADKLRKIMGKKLPEEMKKERGKFVDGCVATIGCDADWAGRLFDKIEGFAGYGFNKSHSVEYTLISYQSMWLKVNYPVEFYAAALTLMDADKLPALLREAKNQGIRVDMPDINNSSKRFEIVTDTRLVIPFQRIKGISEKTADAILEARATGRFMDKTDFLARVEKRRCNVRHQDALDKVGAFAWIEPGQIRPDDPRRVRDQVELVPGLVSAHVPVNRDMHTDKATKIAIAEVVDDYRAKHGPGAKEVDGMPVKPMFGREAVFMIIADAPGNQEDGAGLMGFSTSSDAVQLAMETAGLDRINAYWTALIKRPKRDRQVTPEEIEVYAPYLKREIEILRPPVIVLLGSQAVRHFLPDFKGKASDMAGKVVYSKDLDANLVVGFAPGEIYHDPDKQNAMNDVFAAVADLL